MELRDALRLLRSEIGLTQTELAGALHVSFTTVSRWENKFTRPNQAASIAIIELAKAHHVSAACLDALNTILFASRADDKAERALTEAVTESMKIERRVLLTSEQLKMTIDNLDIGIVAQRFFTNSPKEADTFYQNDFFANLLGYTAQEFSAKLQDDPFFAIAPEFSDNFWGRLTELLNHEIRLTDFVEVIRMLRADNSDVWVEVKAISLQVFSYGQELFTACRDVTARIDAERRYKRELMYREASLRGFFASLHIDLQSNTVMLNRGVEQLIGRPLAGERADALLKLIASSIPEGESKEAYLKQYNRGELLAAFERDELFGKMRIFNTVARRWLRLDYILLQNPSTEHIEALIYACDIQNHVLADKMLNIISERFFDYIGCIDVETKQLQTWFVSDKYRGLELGGQSTFPDCCAEQLRRTNSKADLAELSIENIMNKLECAPFYSAAVEIIDSNGTVSSKTVTFTYLSDNHEQIIAAQTELRNALNCCARKMEASSEK